MITNEELYIRNLVRSPKYCSATRTWDVEYVENNAWLTQKFNDLSKAQNFYLDKYEYHQYWFQVKQGHIR